MEKDPLTSFVRGDYTKRPKSKFWRVINLAVLIIICFALGLMLLLLTLEKVKPIPNAVLTEGVVIQKYYERVRRGLDAPIIIYRYQNPYFESKPQRPVKTKLGVMIANNGRPGRQEVGRNFYKKHQVGDKIIVKYRASSNKEESAIKGGTPLGRAIFHFLGALFFLGMCMYLCLFARNIIYKPDIHAT